MMTNIFSRSLALIGFAAGFVPALAGAFCIQNFNAYGPVYAGDTKERTGLFTQEITRDNGCALVQLQEVWNAGQIDQVDAGLRDWFTVMAPNRQQRIGLMSFVQGQILQQETHVFKVNNQGGVLDSVREMAGVSKGFHAARVQISKTDASLPLWMVNTHLHPSSARVRTLQLFEIIRWRLQHQASAMILSGDFNMTTTSLERRFIMEALGALDSAELANRGYAPGFCTYCEANPRSWMKGNYVFDYVFVANGAEARGFEPIAAVVNLKGMGDFSLSDHYGLRVELLEGTTQPVERGLLEQRRQDLLATIDEVARDWKQDAATYQSQLRELAAWKKSLESKGGAFWTYFSRLR